MNFYLLKNSNHKLLPRQLTVPSAQFFCFSFDVILFWIIILNFLYTLKMFFSYWCLTLFVQGGLIQPTLFSDGNFSMKKCCWKSQFSWLFLINYKISENQKNWFFTVLFLVDLEGVGTLCSPRTQTTFKSPALLGLNLYC